MGLREWMNANQTVVAGVCVVVLAVAVVWLIGGNIGGGSGGRSSASGQVWYEDVTTGERFKAPASKLPPIQSPDGNKAVRAVMYSCGDCSNPDERFVGYYEKLPPKTKKRWADVGRAPPKDQYRFCAGTDDPSKKKSWQPKQRGVPPGQRLANLRRNISCPEGQTGTPKPCEQSD